MARNLNDLIGDFKVSVESVMIKKDSTDMEAIRHSEVVVEHQMMINVNNECTMNVVCSPSNLEYMVIGHLVTEGLIKNYDEISSLRISEDGEKAEVILKEYHGANWVKPEVLSWVPYEKEVIYKLVQRFSDDSAVHKSTNGTHSCYLWYEDSIVYEVEDIGRHNTLDKAIGYIVKNSLDRNKCILYSTGRVPTDMARKVILAGIPILVAKAIPTQQSLMLAKKYNLTLICRAWPDSYEVYNKGDN